MLIVIGGIVLWGFLTDWTFSGLLPRKGAKCTPEDDAKDAHGKQYVYDEDKKCTVIQTCEDNWQPNSSNTACISSSSGGEIKACDPTTTDYDSVQDGKCLNDNNEIVDCTATGPAQFKDITFKSSCGGRDIVVAGFDLGIVGCNTPASLQAFCNNTPGCIGYRRFGNGCARLLLNENPVCEHFDTQMYVEQKNKDLDKETGKIIDSDSVDIYLNTTCFNSPDATSYETWGDDPTQPVGGGCDANTEVHKTACSANSECVGFRFNTGGTSTPNTCSHFLRKKTT